ncbi:hypothetical protein LZ32DRAFT_619769 [Colletotrichum eremochloae]|nr:hypothetical protein LZ32DRAFT_619769 [Colletotrichum eremochloae]
MLQVGGAANEHEHAQSLQCQLETAPTRWMDRLLSPASMQDRSIVSYILPGFLPAFAVPTFGSCFILVRNQRVCGAGNAAKDNCPVIGGLRKLVVENPSDDRSRIDPPTREISRDTIVM